MPREEQLALINLLAPGDQGKQVKIDHFRSYVGVVKIELCDNHRDRILNVCLCG